MKFQMSVHSNDKQVMHDGSDEISFALKEATCAKREGRIPLSLHLPCVRSAARVTVIRLMAVPMKFQLTSFLELKHRLSVIRVSCM